MLGARTWQPITLISEGPARPQWALTPSPGEFYLTMNPTQAERTCPKMRYCFYPRERLIVERQNSIGVGKVQNALQDDSRTVGRKRQCQVNIRGPQDHPAFTPILEGREAQP